MIRKKIFQIILVLLVMASNSQSLLSQVDTSKVTISDTANAVPKSFWKIIGAYSFNISESTFTNWSAGGTNQLGLLTFLKPVLIYDDKRWSWETTLDLRYGVQKMADGTSKKTEDVLRMESKLGKRISKNWKLSGLYTLNTQFAPSKSGNEINSAFFAPAYTNLSIGFDYNPNPKLSIYMTPGNVRSTYVFNDSLSAKGSFGVSPGKNLSFNFGPSFLISHKADLFKNFLIDNKLGVFMNLIDGIGNPVVNWDGIITMKINKYLATTFTYNLFYDPDSKVNMYDDNGQITGQAAKIQFKQTLGFGFNIQW